jgi:hypothetical protein
MRNDARQVANAVAKDPASIGYGGIAYATGIRAIAVKRDENSEAVSASLQTVQSGHYPLSRNLFFYTIGEPQGEVKVFIDWVLGTEGQKICEAVGYYPLISEVIARSFPASRGRDAFSDRFAALMIKGSAFLTIISLILIFIFIGKEALPVLTSPEVHKEADLETLFMPHAAQEGGLKEFNWQPVSEVPKYSLLPLFVGTLKVTVIAVLFAIPLAVAAALYTAEFASSWIRASWSSVLPLVSRRIRTLSGMYSRLNWLITWGTPSS